MFASRTFGALQGGRNSLDVPVASLAGLAVAFLAFAAPADVLETVVVATGLPEFIPAAAPPLGFNARIAVAAGGAMIAFALVLIILRLLDRFGRRREEEEDDIVTEMEPPRLRRRDIHPDAPSRPPLLAVHELGEPELELRDGEPMEAPEARETPPWLQEASPLARKPESPAAPEEPEEWAAPETPPVTPASPDRADAFALSQRNWPDLTSDVEPEPQPEPHAPHPWLAEPEEPVFEAPQWDSPSPMPNSWDAAPAEPGPTNEADGPWQAEITADPGAYEPYGQPEIPRPEPQTAPFDSPPAEPHILHEAASPPAAPPTSPPEGSIAELMERLERGLARQRTVRSEPERAVPAATPDPAPVRPIAPDAGDDRLQSAIESLQRFASRQD